MSSQEKDWIKEVEKEKERIKNWKLSDRLSMVSKLTFMNGSLASSVTGWNSWLTNPLIMEQLTEEEIKELTTCFEKIALEFLELDLKYTRIMREKQKETKVESKEGKENSRKPYVA